MPLPRRRAAAICLVLAPLCYVVSQGLIPAGANGFSEAAALSAVRAAPVAWTLACVLNWSLFTLLIPGVVALTGYLRNRGRTLGMVGAVLLTAGAGISGVGLTENVLMLVAAQAPDPAAAAKITDAFNETAVALGFDVLTYLGIIGVFLALIGAVRGGLTRWWVPVLWLLGFVIDIAADQLVSGVPLALAALPFAAAPVLLALALWRAAGVSPVERIRRRDAAPAELPAAV